MKKLIVLGVILGALALVVGCSLTLPYSDQVLTGTIGGDAFTFVDGYIDADGNVDMYDEAKDFTDVFSFSETYPKIIFTWDPVEIGEKKLSLNLFDLVNSYTITGVSTDLTNYIFTDGNIEITEVTATEVKGRMHITYENDKLDGTFTLKRVDW